MKSCAQCQQQNQEDAKFCYQCGNTLAVEPEPPIATPVIHTDEHLWRQFIGPHADRYLKHFKKFGLGEEPKFALTWNWPAFLYISFLWFLYRKMYVYALVYALGPMISTYLTGDLTVGLVWSIMAGATANYVYYWHCREHIGEIKKSSWTDPAKQDEVLKEAWRRPALRDLDRSRLLRVVRDDHDQNASGWATRRRTVARETGETDCSEHCVNQKLFRWHPVHPRLKLIRNLVHNRPARIGSFLLLLQLV